MLVASRTCDLLVNITSKNGCIVAIAIKLLVNAHAINAYDARDILENIRDIKALDDIQNILDNIKIGEEK